MPIPQTLLQLSASLSSFLAAFSSWDIKQHWWKVLEVFILWLTTANILQLMAPSLKPSNTYQAQKNREIKQRTGSFFGSPSSFIYSYSCQVGLLWFVQCEARGIPLSVCEHLNHLTKVPLHARYTASFKINQWSTHGSGSWFWIPASLGEMYHTMLETELRKQPQQKKRNNISIVAKQFSQNFRISTDFERMWPCLGLESREFPFQFDQLFFKFRDLRPVSKISIPRTESSWRHCRCHWILVVGCCWSVNWSRTDPILLAFPWVPWSFGARPRAILPVRHSNPWHKHQHKTAKAQSQENVFCSKNNN